MNYYIGIDVAKATLQVYVPEGNQDIEISNTKTALKSLYSKLKKVYKKEQGRIVIVYESTGSYSTILEDFAQKQNIKCFKVGAVQSASFAKTIKNRSKTDKVDARMLSRMSILALAKDIKVPYRDEKAHQIRSLMKYYQSLAKEQTRISNYLEAAKYNKEDSFVIKRLEQKILKLKKEQKELITKILQIIEVNEKYKKAYENIISINGVGEKSAIILLYLFLRYPKASRQHITALCGLDPIHRESGTSLKKRAKISKQGMSLVRSILFMPVMTAVVTNEEMKYYYDKLLERGKCKSLAQIAIMRKIVLLAHSLYKNDEKYDSEMYLNHLDLKDGLMS